mgnify:FL=1
MTYIPRSCRKHLWIKNRNNLLKYDFPLIFFLILLSACSKEDIQIIQQSNSNKIFVTYQESKTKLPNGNSCALIAINQHFNDSTDFGAIFGNKEHTINKNFDFQNLFLIKRIGELPNTSQSPNDTSYHYLAGHDTDYIVAMRICSESNSDGDFPDFTDKFTGGYHGYDSQTSGNYTPTMYELNKEVFANGSIMKAGESGYYDSLKIIVRNLVQGSNTEKKDGSGRNILLQEIILKCLPNKTFNIQVNLTPLENIRFYQVNGLCAFNDFDSIQFISSDNKSKLYPKDHVFRYQDARVDTIRQISENCFFDIFINPFFGIGTGIYNGNDYNASIESANKSYFWIIDKREGLFVPQGTIFSFRGGFKLESR